MLKPLDELTKCASPEFREIGGRLAEIIACSGVPLDPAIKWGQLTYARDGDFHHWVCAIGLTKRTVGLSFHFGGLLDDPAGVFKTGSSAFLRKIEYRTIADVNETVILGFLEQALARLDYFKENWQEIQKHQ